MKNKICLWGALLLLLTVSSCRKDSDTLINYNSGDLVAYGDAQNSYAEQFKLFWHGMDQNYCLFAYERTFGLDWDAIYDEYLPQFEALDHKETVTDDEYKELLSKVVSQLHDGHYYATFLNYKTGEYLMVNPQDIRNKATRKDYESTYGFIPNLKYYYPALWGGNGEFKSCNNASARFSDFLGSLFNNPNKGAEWLNKQIFALKMKSSHTEHEAFLLDKYTELYDALNRIYNDNMLVSQAMGYYNELAKSYSFLKVPGLIVYDPSLGSLNLCAFTSVTQDNIAYFYFNNFSLSAAISESFRNSQLPNLTDDGKAMLNEIYTVWRQWFDNVQNLIKAGQLKGVIIDVRSNPGGYANDFQYVLGTLLPTGTHEIGKVYYKRGVGRFDYSVNMPHTEQGYPEAHEAITNQPVVILTNCNSVSMSEFTTISAKELLNACQIGTTSWGGICGLSDNVAASLNYSGHVGIDGKTPVYCRVPQHVFQDLQGNCYEGVGLKPNIEVDFDDDLYKASGRDTQFERALEYIRNGN